MKDLMKILPALAKSLPESAELREAVLFAAWKKAAGAGLRDHSIPISVDGKTMKIAVRDEIWKKHLEKLAPQIRRRLNFHMESIEITYLDFIVEEERFPLADESDLESDTAVMKDSEADIGFLAERAEVISDPSLRRKYLEAARAYFGIRKN